MGGPNIFDTSYKSLQFLDDDKCCVIVTCAGNAELDDVGSPCHGIECGPNAECRHEVRPIGDQDATMPGATICVCRDGHTGDPDDLERGCAIDMRKGPSTNDVRTGGEEGGLPNVCQTVLIGCVNA